ncbi:hypothetical protein [Gordonia soli]|uniref:Secreted protein n=1 Tax=Gordonia soli NBRC 108243 TaxID=1223545 RepID=M0QP07_9ACTN|nr:hypothetical protein [Gordonia soli]GAC69177.1 hypothetical protein GS4_22_00090 [Gordonia soli NBRC 108243]
MNRSGLFALAAAVGMALVSMGAGTATAATTGLELSGAARPNCTATITLVNHTNSTNYVPDWWFDQENDPAMVNATTIPATMPSPWREVNGIPWPIARWVGDPALRSGVADGVPVWGTPGVPYRTGAQPEGFTTTKTLDLKTAVGAPAPTNGTKTIWFRLRTGPQTADRLPTPQKLVVTGCRSTTGSIDIGITNFGSVF